MSIVLVVDDEDVFRDCLVDALLDSGIKALSARNGKRALKLLDLYGDEISLVLLDWNMPEMGGAATFYRLRQTRPVLPVIFVSGNAAEILLAVSDHFTPTLVDDKNVHTLHKPFNIDDLLKMVNSLLKNGDKRGSTELTSSSN